jgi:hypothetical protein
LLGQLAYFARSPGVSQAAASSFGIRLELNKFIAHPRSKRMPHWSDQSIPTSSAIFTGRRLETVTVGRMPGHQVIVYDKTAEARVRQKLHFFEAWSIDPNEIGARVWRLELRLGKKELYDEIKIKVIGDLIKYFRPALLVLLKQVRYIASDQRGQNVTRHHLHPIWELASRHVGKADLLSNLGEVPPHRILEITRSMFVERHTKLILGNAAALSAVLDMDDVEISDSLPMVVADCIATDLESDGFRRALVRARDKHSFNLSDDLSKDSESF